MTLKSLFGLDDKPTAKQAFELLAGMFLSHERVYVDGQYSIRLIPNGTYKEYLVTSYRFRPQTTINRYTGKEWTTWSLIATCSIYSERGLYKSFRNKFPFAEVGVKAFPLAYTNISRDKIPSLIKWLRDYHRILATGTDAQIDSIESFIHLQPSIMTAGELADKMEDNYNNFFTPDGSNQFKQKVSDNIYQSMFGTASSIANK